ncbi:hypothetical protein OIU74_030161 [Salix koriyanagi]|uniref:Uncharacterized protein n=1 Tax=Salix koriyanagi TaxID=2511006 RepID=A0A9Q0VFV3_9ROSI|nr:hypothetical protein OIU74_030161 [Salix koriyanagi]
MGRQAKAIKSGRERGGRGDRGPWSRAKRRSLKLASQERKKEERALRVKMEISRGRRRNMQMTGMIAKSLVVPLSTNLTYFVTVTKQRQD